MDEMDVGSQGRNLVYLISCRSTEVNLISNVSVHIRHLSLSSVNRVTAVNGKTRPGEYSTFIPQKIRATPVTRYISY